MEGGREGGRERGRGREGGREQRYIARERKTRCTVKNYIFILERDRDIKTDIKKHIDREIDFANKTD